MYPIDFGEPMSKRGEGGLKPCFGSHTLTQKRVELMSCKSPPLLSLVRGCTRLILVNLGQKKGGGGRELNPYFGFHLLTRDRGEPGGGLRGGSNGHIFCFPGW